MGMHFDDMHTSIYDDGRSINLDSDAWNDLTGTYNFRFYKLINLHDEEQLEGTFQCVCCGDNIYGTLVTQSSKGPYHFGCINCDEVWEEHTHDVFGCMDQDTLPPIVPTEFGREEAPLDSIAEVLGYTSMPQSAGKSPQSGLKNFGNTCYANSVLFALASMGQVRSWALTHEKSHKSKRCVLCALAADIRQMIASWQNGAHTPMLQNRSTWVPEAYDRLRGTGQQDASEFFLCLMNVCQECDVHWYTSVENGLPNSSTEYTSPLWEYFGIHGTTRTCCKICNQQRTKFWREICLSLTNVVASKSRILLEDCLMEYLSTCAIEDTDDRCDRCKNCACRTQQYGIRRWPPVLCLTLKRYTDLAPRQVVFPEILPEQHGFGKQRPEYRLQAVVVHHGVDGVGHYTTFARSDGNLWLHFDDRKTPEPVASIAEVLKAKAYLLFYTKVDNAMHKPSCVSIAVSSSPTGANSNSTPSHEDSDSSKRKTVDLRDMATESQSPAPVTHFDASLGKKKGKLQQTTRTMSSTGP